MKNLGRALKAGAKGFAKAFEPARYEAGGIVIRCSHCKGDIFKAHEALLNTSVASISNMDWLEKSGTALCCENCGLIQWYSKKPDKLDV